MKERDEVRTGKQMAKIIAGFKEMLQPYIDRTVVMKSEDVSEHMSSLFERFNLRINEHLLEIADRVMIMLVWEENLTDDDTELLHRMVKDLHEVNMINRRLVRDQGLNDLVSEILGEDFT